jgi:hypothetical protein
LVFVAGIAFFLPVFVPDLIHEGLTRDLLRRNPFNTLCAMPYLGILGAGKWSLDSLIESRLESSRRELATPSVVIANEPDHTTTAEAQNRNE